MLFKYIEWLLTSMTITIILFLIVIVAFTDVTFIGLYHEFLTYGYDK